MQTLISNIFRNRIFAGWLFLAVLGVVGAVFPFWFYGQVRPLVAQAVGLPLGIGPGVWLNGAGHLLVTAVAIQRLKAEG